MEGKNQEPSCLPTFVVFIGFDCIMINQGERHQPEGAKWRSPRYNECRTRILFLYLGYIIYLPNENGSLETGKKTTLVALHKHPQGFHGCDFKRLSAS